jgi:hypothetical protein
VLQVASVLVPTAVFWVTAGAVMFAVFVKIPFVPVLPHTALEPTNCVIVMVPVAPDAMLPPVQTISGSPGVWSMHVNPLSPLKEIMGIVTEPRIPLLPGTLSVTLMPLTVEPVLFCSVTVHVIVPPGFTIAGFPTFRKVRAAGGMDVAVGVRVRVGVLVLAEVGSGVTVLFPAPHVSVKIVVLLFSFDSGITFPGSTTAVLVNAPATQAVAFLDTTIVITAPPFPPICPPVQVTVAGGPAFGVQMNWLSPAELRYVTCVGNVS